MRATPSACPSRQPRERRRSRRVSCKRPLHVVSGEGVWSAETLDICEDGVRLACTEAPLPAQSRLKLFMALPSPARGSWLCLLEGEVVWAEGGTAGVRFVDLPAESKICLQLLVA